jgi:Putative MetA-pathway of phenol degradation
VNNVELELKLNADLELIKNQLYFGANLLFEPEGTHDPDRVGAGWEMESKFGVSGALAYRVTSGLLIGAEAWYLRHYEGMWLNAFNGDAVFVGPTLYYQISRKMFVTAAWNVQVTGARSRTPTLN